VVLSEQIKQARTLEEIQYITELENAVPVLMYARQAMKKKGQAVIGGGPKSPAGSMPPSAMSSPRGKTLGNFPAQSTAGGNNMAGNGTSSSTAASSSAVGAPALQQPLSPSSAQPRMKLVTTSSIAVMQRTAEQTKAWEERSQRLKVERKMLLKKTEDNVAAFAETLEQLRIDRHSVTADLKLAELKLLVLFQEYQLLQTFEGKDISLQQRQLRCEKEKNEIVQNSADFKTKLDHKIDELKSWNDKSQVVAADLKALLPDNHPYGDILTKIFKKKIKRNKTANGGDEDDEEEDEYDSDNDDDLDEVSSTRNNIILVLY
jgi:hypothetical protein